MSSPAGTTLHSLVFAPSKLARLSGSSVVKESCRLVMVLVALRAALAATAGVDRLDAADSLAEATRSWKVVGGREPGSTGCKLDLPLSSSSSSSSLLDESTTPAAAAFHVLRSSLTVDVKTTSRASYTYTWQFSGTAMRAVTAITDPHRKNYCTYTLTSLTAYTEQNFYVIIVTSAYWPPRK